VRPVPASGGAKPAAAPAAGAFGAPAASSFGSFGKPAVAPLAMQPAGGAAQVVDSAKAAADSVKIVKFFTAEHYIPASLTEDKQSDKTRRQGSASATRPEISDFKQRPLVLERFVRETDHARYPHYVVVLDRAKHTVLNHFGQTDGHKAWEVVPRPGPDNLFHMLAILAIELKVSSHLLATPPPSKKHDNPHSTRNTKAKFTICSLKCSRREHEI
jgi:hypothetical protein